MPCREDWLEGPAADVARVGARAIRRLWDHGENV